MNVHPPLFSTPRPCNKCMACGLSIPLFVGRGTMHTNGVIVCMDCYDAGRHRGLTPDKWYPDSGMGKGWTLN